MKNVIILLLLQLALCVKGFTQNFGDCAYIGNNTVFVPKSLNCNSSGADYMTKYRMPGFWTPDDNTPIKTIKVNIVVTQSSDPTKPHWTDNPAFRTSVDIMFDKVNQVYSNVQPKNYVLPCEPSLINFIYDTRIRFELNEIIFLPANDLFYYSGRSGGSDAGTQIADYLIANYPSSKVCLNHVFSMPTTNTFGAWGWWSPRNDIAIVNTWFSMWGQSMYWDDHVHHFAHEYGHALGLHHTYDSDIRDINDFDFLDDVYGNCRVTSCYNPALDGNPPLPPNMISYLTTGCYFNIQPSPYPLMSNKQDLSNPTSFYISPKMAGKMHRSLSLYADDFGLGNTMMPQCARGPHPSTSTPYYISTNETWDFAIKMYQNIVVLPGATLTIKCKLSMPHNGQINVMPGGKLIIEAVL